MPNIGPTELIVILVIALLVLGPKKLPEVGNSLGNGLSEIKDSMSGDRGSHIGDADLQDEPYVPAQVAAAPKPVAAAPKPVEVASAQRSTTSEDV